jgi:hypothetical protein
MTFMNKVYRQISLCLAVLCLFCSAYSQNDVEEVSVELKSNTAAVRKADTITFYIKVTNNSSKELYVVRENFKPSWNLTKRKLSVNLDYLPAATHFFEFPKLTHLKPKRSVKFEIKVPVSVWSEIDSGEWVITAYVGVLDKKTLKTKTKVSGRSAIDATEFMKLQKTFSSNEVQIEVLDK